MLSPLEMENILERYVRKKKDYSLKCKKLRKGFRDLDQWFREVHDQVFADLDCLDCARCCRGLGPLIRERDIQRLSKSLKMKETQLIESYFQIDEEGDYIFKEIPCPFLGEDHYCFVYADRPDACRRYPHTDQRRMKGRLNTLLKDCAVCPAAVLILEEVISRAESQ